MKVTVYWSQLVMTKLTLILTYRLKLLVMMQGILVG